MIPRFRPQLGWKEIADLAIGKGPSLGDLEGKAAKEYGLSEMVWFPLGRVAAQAFLETLDTKKNRVALSPFNCIALGNAIYHAQWRPHYVDTQGFNQNLTFFSEAIAKEEVGAGIVVSLWGIPEGKFERATSTPLLYDYALRGLDTELPSLQDGDAVMYSLNWGKSVSALKGAFLGTQNPERAAQWRAWRDKRLLPGSRLSDLREAGTLALAFQPSLFQLASAMVDRFPLARRLSGRDEVRKPIEQKCFAPTRGLTELTERALSHREALLTERLMQVKRYDRELRGLDLLLPPSDAALSHYAIRCADAGELSRNLKKVGIFASHQLFDKLLGDYAWLSDGSLRDCPSARKLTGQTLHLPLFFGLEAKTQVWIAKQVRALTGKQREERHAASISS